MREEYANNTPRKGFLGLSWPGFAVLVAMAAVMIGMMLMTPRVVDDMKFLDWYIEATGTDVLSFAGVWDYWRFMAENDCIRLSNIFILPGVLSATAAIFIKVIIGLCAAMTCWQIARFASPKSRMHPLLLLAVWAAMVVFLPWRHYMFIMAFSANYVVTGVMLLALAAFTARHCGTTNITQAIAGICLALLITFWHEGFGIPVACGLVFVAIMRQGKVPAWIYVAALSVVVGVIIEMQVGGMTNRWARESIKPAWRTDLAKTAFSNCLTIGLWLLALCSICIPRGRKWMTAHLTHPAFAFCAASASASAVIALATAFSIRTGYPSQLAALVCWAMILWPIISRWHSWVKTTLAIIIALGLCVQSATALIWQHNYASEHEEIMAQIPYGQSITIYRDILMPEDLPKAALWFPTRSIWIEAHHLDLVRINCGGSDLNIAVVPTALDRMDLMQQPIVDDKYGASVVDGVIFTRNQVPDDVKANISPDLANPRIDVQLTDGTWLHGVPSFETGFIAPDGNMYFYLKPFSIRTSQVRSVKIP